jgi:hypothetical protein
MLGGRVCRGETSDEDEAQSFAEIAGYTDR